MELPLQARRVKRYLRYLLVRVALAGVAWLSLGRAVQLGEALGAAAFLLLRTERRRALDSLRLAFPERTEAERRALARDCFRHLGRCALEMACAHKLDPGIDRWVEWPEADRRVLDAALARGRGVVLVSAHVGNWELLGRRLALAGYPIQSIARETPDPRLTALIDRHRTASGLRIIWRGRSNAARQILRALKSGEILALLIDQDTRVQSVFVPFFGLLASTPRAAADIVLHTGAAAVVSFCQRQASGRYRLSIHEVEPHPTGDREADTVALTARLTEAIEQAIRRAPSQWVWMHRRWKTRPS